MYQHFHLNSLIDECLLITSKFTQNSMCVNALFIVNLCTKVFRVGNDQQLIHVPDFLIALY